MAEYIEREKLKEAFENADPDVCENYPDGYSDWGFGRQNIRDVINSIPAADVAEVVRCRDCQKFKTYGCRMVASGYDDFCSYGERKDVDNAEGGHDPGAVYDAAGLISR